MTDSRSGRRAGRRPRGVGALIGFVLLSAACGIDPSLSPGHSDPVTPSPSGAAPATSSPVQPTQHPQTDTAWGRIWDVLPVDFPLPPGARPTQTGAGPASATLDVEGGPAETLTFMQAALERSGFRTESLSEPLEDGSQALESVGVGGCRVRSEVAPLGGTTVLMVLYGAACPAP